MSALLYIGGVLYLLAVIRTTGKRYDADFISWQEAMHRATVGSVLNGKCGEDFRHENHQHRTFAG